MHQTNYTAVIVAVAVIVVLGAIIIFGPASQSEKVTQALLGFIAVVVSAAGILQNQKANELHTLVNSRMDQSEAKNVEAKRLAKEDADVRVREAELRGREEERHGSQSIPTERPSEKSDLER